MYVYNITFVITPQIHNKWMKWIHEVYIDNLLKNKYVKKIKMFKIITNSNELTYALHHKIETPEELKKFVNEQMPILNTKIFETFGEKVLTFGTELKEIPLKIS